MNKIIISAATAILLAGTSVAFAQTAAMSAGATMDFKALDTDGNAMLSLDEAKVAWPDLTQEKFEAADANHDGSLQEDEANSLNAQAGDMTKDSTVQSTDQTNKTTDN